MGQVFVPHCVETVQILHLPQQYISSEILTFHIIFIMALELITLFELFGIIDCADLLHIKLSRQVLKGELFCGAQLLSVTWM